MAHFGSILAQKSETPTTDDESLYLIIMVRYSQFTRVIDDDDNNNNNNNIIVRITVWYRMHT